MDKDTARARYEFWKQVNAADRAIQRWGQSKATHAPQLLEEALSVYKTLQEEQPEWFTEYQKGTLV